MTGSLVCGSAVLIPLAGLLCEYGFDGGWPFVFYVFGLYDLLCVLGDVHNGLCVAQVCLWFTGACECVHDTGVFTVQVGWE